MPATAALKPASARIDQILNAWGMWIALAITNDAIPVEVDVMVGKPDPEDVEQFLGTGGAIVYIETQAGAKQEPNYASFNRYREVFTPSPLTASFAQRVLTLEGAPAPNLNVHVIGGWPTVDAYYQTTEEDVDLPTVAANIAQVCADEGLPNAVNGAAITFQTPIIKCNIGATGTIVREVMKLRQRFKAIVLARSADNEVSPQLGLRSAIGHAIISQIGTMASDNLPIDDGTIEIIRHIDNWFVDKAQSDFGVVEYHLLYEIMYGILESTAAAQIGSMNVDVEAHTPGGGIISHTAIDG